MSRLIIDHFFSHQKYRIIAIYLLVILLLFYVLLPNKDETYLVLMFTNQYIEEYNNLIYQVLKIITPLLLIFMTNEHDDSFLNTIAILKGRRFVFNHKILVYTSLIILNTSVLFLLYLVTIKFMNQSILFSKDSYNMFIGIFIDSIILLFIIVLLIRKRVKNYVIVIGIIYIIINLFNIYDIFKPLYYFFPINTTYSIFNDKVICFQMLYISLLYLLSLNKYLNEDLT